MVIQGKGFCMKHLRTFFLSFAAMMVAILSIASIGSRGIDSYGALIADIATYLNRTESLEAGMTNWIMLVDCDDWGGEETGEGSTASNALVWTGYSTPNATNNSNAGDAWFSANAALQDLYFYQTVYFPADMIRLVELKLLVRSSSTATADNYVTLLLDDTYNTGSTASKCSASADVWSGFTCTVDEDWTNNVPTMQNAKGGLALTALNARIDAFVKDSNKIQAQLWGQVICR
jgi:hypothetical protein